MKSGFTLVELIATFAIIVVIALGVFIQFRQLSPTQSLENAADVTRSVLLDARTRAMAGLTCCATSTTPVGYGMYLELNGAPDNTLVLFAETDGDYLYTAADTTLSTTILDDAISVLSCEDETTVTTSGSCTVVFQSDGLSGLYYNGTLATGKGIIYTFIEPDSTSMRLITLYPATYVIE